jgi:hypothetical protein
MLLVHRHLRSRTKLRIVMATLFAVELLIALAIVLALNSSAH